jgi:hypothetical protein
MRRLWATAASGAIILLSAGCTTEPATTTTGAPTPAVGVVTPATPATPAPGTSVQASDPAGDKALAGNTPAICSQAAKTSGDAAARLAQNLKSEADAASSKDKLLVEKAQQQTQRDVQNWGSALTDLSGLVADATVKKALGAMGKEITQLKGDAKKLDAAKITSLQKTLTDACSKS